MANRAGLVLGLGAVLLLSGCDAGDLVAETLTTPVSGTGTVEEILYDPGTYLEGCRQLNEGYPEELVDPDTCAADAAGLAEDVVERARTEAGELASAG